MTGSLSIRLNSAHRPSTYRSVFRAHGRLHIPDILNASDAEALRETLQDVSEWTRTIHVEAGRDLDISVGDLESISPDERAKFEQSLTRSSTDNLQYIFDTVRISAQIAAGHSVADPLWSLHDFFNSQIFLNFISQMTGDYRLGFADVMATRYLSGHFLTAHGDEHPSERRLYAYVLNLTPQWRADWGGILMFLDEDGHVAEGYVPAFNALNIFSVPQTHTVSMVTQLARMPRMSVTGWIHARK